MQPTGPKPPPSTTVTVNTVESTVFRGKCPVPDCGAETIYALVRGMPPEYKGCKHFHMLNEKTKQLVFGVPPA